VRQRKAVDGTGTDLVRRRATLREPTHKLNGNMQTEAAENLIADLMKEQHTGMTTSLEDPS